MLYVLYEKPYISIPIEKLHQTTVHKTKAPKVKLSFNIIIIIFLPNDAIT